MTDPIADMLTRIRNAQAVHAKTVVIPHSQIKAQIADTLKKESYISDVKVDTKQPPQSTITLSLRYIDNHAAISSIKRVSRPGRRFYQKAKKIKPYLSGHGITIISTSQGVMTAKEAKKNSLGGEIICKLW